MFILGFSRFFYFGFSFGNLISCGLPVPQDGDKAPFRLHFRIKFHGYTSTRDKAHKAGNRVKGQAEKQERRD